MASDQGQFKMLKKKKQFRVLRLPDGHGNCTVVKLWLTGDF